MSTFLRGATKIPPKKSTLPNKVDQILNNSDKKPKNQPPFKLKVVELQT